MNVNMQQIEKAWNAMMAATGVSGIRDERGYEHALSVVEEIFDRTRGREDHPLRGALAWLAPMIADYEARKHPVRTLKPAAFLGALMEQHDLRQSDLPEIGAQSVVSAVLGGKRQLNARQIAALARRFKVPADVFVG